MLPNSDLSAYDFEVYGTSSDKDITNPTIDLGTLQVVCPNEGRATVGDTITVSVNLSDDRGVDHASVTFVCMEQNGEKTVNLTYAGDDPDQKNGVWQGEFAVDDQTENGLWIIHDIFASDTSNNRSSHYNANWNSGVLPNSDLSAYNFEVTSPECPLDLTDSGYSMMLDGAGATTTFGGNYYVNELTDVITPTAKVRFDAEDGTWTTLSPRKYTLKYEKKTGEDSWEDYTADTFGVDESGTATYRVSATGKESLYYTGTVGPVEFNVIKKCKVTFDTRGGSSIIPQYIIPGEKATEPADPTREGWHFNEWFTDEGLTDEYWFGRAVNEDITLHAGWYTNMALGVYNKSNPDTWPYNFKCGTVDMVADTAAEWHKTDAGTMNFTAPEGNITFTAKPADGYTFKGWYGGNVGSSYFVEGPTDELLSGEAEYTCASGETAICAVFECAGHQWEEKIQKATPDAEGRIYGVCSICGTENTEDGIIPLPKVSNIKLAGTSYAYTGKAITPKVTVANAGEELSADVYDVTCSNNTNVGTATVKVTLKGDYYEGSKTLTFKITKAANPLTIKPKTATLKYSKLKKKSQTLAVTKVIKFTKKLSDKKTYTLSSAKRGSKSFKKYFKISKTTGKVTVKKGLKKGTYKVKVKVKALGNSNYKASTVKTVTFKVVVN